MQAETVAGGQRLLESKARRKKPRIHSKSLGIYQQTIHSRVFVDRRCLIQERVRKAWFELEQGGEEPNSQGPAVRMCCCIGSEGIKGKVQTGFR